jgi:hypothetical protein
MIGLVRAATIVWTLARRGARLAVLPAAAVCVLSCGESRASYTIRVMNRDTVTLDSVVIAGGGTEARFGSVLAGQEVRRTLTLDHDALLFLNGLRGRQPMRVLLGEYAGRGPAARADVVVTKGGEIQVGKPVPQ